MVDVENFGLVVIVLICLGLLVLLRRVEKLEDFRRRTELLPPTRERRLESHRDEDRPEPTVAKQEFKAAGGSGGQPTITQRDLHPPDVEQFFDTIPNFPAVR
jgi:hypothetical protein